jgi:hypothetical protein
MGGGVKKEDRECFFCLARGLLEGALWKAISFTTFTNMVFWGEFELKASCLLCRCSNT